MMVDKYNWKRGPAQPAAPVVGNLKTKQGPHANGKKSAESGHHNHGASANGSLKAQPKPAGGTTRTEAPMAPTAAEKLYPSARRSK